MKQYMLFIREDLEKVKQLSEEAIQEDIELMTKWIEQISKTGNYLNGEPLEPEVRMVKDGEIISDGPFIETKEALSGYLVIQAENLELASQIALTCPLLKINIKSIEVRPILKF